MKKILVAATSLLALCATAAIAADDSAPITPALGGAATTTPTDPSAAIPPTPALQSSTPHDLPLNTATSASGDAMSAAPAGDASTKPSSDAVKDAPKQ